MKIKEKEVVYEYIRMYDQKEFLKLDQSRKFIKEDGEIAKYYIVSLAGNMKQVDIVRDLDKTVSRDLLIRFININKDKFKDIKEINAYENKDDNRSLYIDLIKLNNEVFNLEVTYYRDDQIGYKDIHDKNKAKDKNFNMIKLRKDMIYYDPYEDIQEIIDSTKKEFISSLDYIRLLDKECVDRIVCDSSESEKGYAKGTIIVIDEDLNKFEYEVVIKF